MAERKMCIATEMPKFMELNDLICERNGGKILFATDDWFATAENLIKATEPEWHEGEFTECGKWMDGWETRRKRIPGHDWAIIQLGVPGVLHGVTVDTAFFTGNYAPRFSIQAGNLTPDEAANIPTRKSTLGGTATPETMNAISKLQTDKWKEIIPMTELHAGYQDTRYNHHIIKNKEFWTHIRLNIYPDGGIARLRLYGQAQLNWNDINPHEMIDLIAMTNGGICLGYSDAHYGHPRNIISPGRGVNMGDGWETARRLDRPCILEINSEGILNVPGCEWAVFRLGHCGSITNIEVDTYHFKGNFPDSICIAGTLVQPGEDWKHASWQTILPSKQLSPHKEHFYSQQVLQSMAPFTHVKVTIAPDGGISRLRLWGFLKNMQQ